MRAELTCGEGGVQRVAAPHQARRGLGRTLQQQHGVDGVLTAVLSVQITQQLKPWVNWSSQRDSELIKTDRQMRIRNPRIYYMDLAKVMIKH